MKDWIYCSNALPEPEQRVIGYDLYYGRIGEAVLASGERSNPHLVFIDSSDCFIMLWTPLPRPIEAQLKIIQAEFDDKIEADKDMR